MKSLPVLLLSCVSTFSNAALITLDPNEFDQGSVLNDALSSVRVSTLHGGDVYSSPLLRQGQPEPPGFIHSGPVGDQVFSTSPTSNTEWMASSLQFPETTFETLDVLRSNHEGFLLFNFFEPVNYVSLLSLEIFPDAGWGGGGDPQRFFLYDSAGSLIHTRWEDQVNPLPVDQSELPFETNPYGYIYNEFHAEGIRYLAVAGESEPTTYGRMLFRNQQAEPVPAPPPLLLLAGGLVAIILNRLFVSRRKAGKPVRSVPRAI